VPGAPTSGSSAGANALPPQHPPIALPEEAVRLLDELAAEAAAAPDDLEAWQRLARGRYRAALIDPSYAPGAKQAIDSVLRLDPDNLEAIRTRGNLAYDMREYAEAQQHLRRYLELDPTDPGVKTDLASCLLFQGDREGAKVLYREVIATRPDFVQAHLNLGIALHADGDREASADALKNALDHSTSPEQRAQVERIIALAEQRSGGEPGGKPAPKAVSNASTSFQRSAETALRTHPIVGPKIAGIEWSGITTGRVSLRDFPMDSMPPVMRNKFKSRINETLAESAKSESVDAEIRIDLVDAGSKRVMDTLDGREWVGAFDEVE
jgi:tetratricopeptide (TPR) repeat protein